MDNATKGRILYEQEGLTLTDIGRRLDVPAATVRSWKHRYRWNEGTTITQHSATSEKVSRKRNTRGEEVTTEERMIASVEANEKLTDKQRAFCLYYVMMLNATRAYQEAYSCSYNVANTEGPKLLVNPCIADEIRNLKKIRFMYFMIDSEDIVTLHMRIAFADITEFLEFGTEAQVMGGFGLDDSPVYKTKNYVHLMESTEVDGQIISKVKQVHGGVSLELADRHKSLAFLERYFELNPINNHQISLKRAKLQIEERALEIKELQHGLNINEGNQTGVVILPEILEDWR